MLPSEPMSASELWRRLAKWRDAQKTHGEWHWLQGEAPAFDVPLVCIPGACARYIRAPVSNIPLKVHRNWNGSYSTLVPEDCEYPNPFEFLTQAEVTLHHLDWVGVCRDLASAARLAGQVTPVEEMPFVWRLGYKLAANGRRPCFFGVPHGEKEAQALADLLRAQKAFLLVLPDADPATSAVFVGVPFQLHVLSDHATAVGNSNRRLIDTVLASVVATVAVGWDSSERPETASATSRPTYALRQELGFWTLVFEGSEARLRPEKGILYVSWLLKHPDQVPIHAIDLAGKIPAIYGRQLGIDSLVDEKTGARVPLQSDSRLQERSLGAEDLETTRHAWHRQGELTAVLEDPDSTEPERAEAFRELEGVSEFLDRHARESKSGADDMVRSVRRAIVRFHEHLSEAAGEKGEPHPVFRAFGEHLAKYLIAPSSRFSGRMGGRVRAGVAGRFTYEPPEGVKWSE